MFGVEVLPDSFVVNHGYLAIYNHMNIRRTGNVDGDFSGRISILNRIIQRDTTCRCSTNFNH